MRLTWRADRDRGSVLALVPAGFLVLMILGALAVDNGATYLGQRQLDSSVEAAANDAAGAAVSNQVFYGQGEIQIDPTQAAIVVCQDMVAQGDQDLLDTSVGMAVVGPAVYVDAHAEVRGVFGSLIPGFAERPVSAQAAAVAAGDATQTAPPAPAPGAYTTLSC
jgi:uncharacterized membrane protein